MLEFVTLRQKRIWHLCLDTQPCWGAPRRRAGNVSDRQTAAFIRLSLCNCSASARRNHRLRRLRRKTSTDFTDEHRLSEKHKKNATIPFVSWRLTALWAALATQKSVRIRGYPCYPWSIFLWLNSYVSIVIERPRLCQRQRAEEGAIALAFDRLAGLPCFRTLRVRSHAHTPPAAFRRGAGNHRRLKMGRARRCLARFWRAVPFWKTARENTESTERPQKTQKAAG